MNGKQCFYKKEEKLGIYLYDAVLRNSLDETLNSRSAFLKKVIAYYKMIFFNLLKEQFSESLDKLGTFKNSSRLIIVHLCTKKMTFRIFMARQ